MRRKSDFAAALKGRKVYSGPGLVVVALPTRHDEGRVGVTVSRQLKRAVDRNRARRRVREVARLALLKADSGAGRGGIRYDVVLIALRGTLEVSYAELQAEASLAALRLAKLTP